MKDRTRIARSLSLLVGCLALILVGACGSTEDEPTPRAEQPAADAPTDATVVAGISFVPPADWTVLGTSGMRQAQYQFPAVGEDTAPGEVNVFYFGPRSGGGVEANLQRWIAQMTVADGVGPERTSFQADGLPGHVIALDGIYTAGGMGPRAGSGEPKPGYRLVGVVLEGPQGSLFFKLTGPAATARAMEPGLMSMVERARKAG